MNEKLLMDLFHIPSMSGREEGIQVFIIDYLDNLKIPYEIDKVGNIYNISHEQKPMLSAHMDTVQDYNDTLFAKFIEIKDNIVNGYGIIGGDDKCGLYVILELLRKGYTDINFCFTVQEEVGGVGSDYFERNNNLDHILYCLVLDRKGNGDILCSGCHDYGTQEFEDVLVEMGKDYGYSTSNGTFCDADNFNNQISCANISVGYYNAHSKQEFVILEDLQNCLNFVHSVISNINIKFEAPEQYGYPYWRGNNSLSDEYDWIDEYDNYDNLSHSSTQITSSHEESEYCDVCSKWKTTKYIELIGLNICENCSDELAQELTTPYIYINDSEVC